MCPYAFRIVNAAARAVMPRSRKFVLVSARARIREEAMIYMRQCAGVPALAVQIRAAEMAISKATSETARVVSLARRCLCP